MSNPSPRAPTAAVIPFPEPPSLRNAHAAARILHELKNVAPGDRLGVLEAVVKIGLEAGVLSPKASGK